MGCKYWTYGYINEDVWYAGKCFLKNVKSNVGPKAALTSGPRNCPNECFEKEIDYPGNDIAEHNSVATPEDCQVLCQHNDQCKYWTYGYITEDVWYAGKCFLKNVKSNVGAKAALSSGPRNCKFSVKLYTSANPHIIYFIIQF